MPIEIASRYRVWGSQGSPQGPDENMRAGEDVWEFDEPPRCMLRLLPIRSSLGAAFWIALFAVLAVFGTVERDALRRVGQSFYKRGQNAETREDYDAAFDNLPKGLQQGIPRICATAPRSTACGFPLQRMHVTKGRKLLDAGNEQGALVEFLHAAEIDPGNEAAQQEIDEMRQKQRRRGVRRSKAAFPKTEGRQDEINSMGSPAELRPVSNEPVTLHMQEDAKVVYQAVGKAAGVNVLFDPDYIPKRIQVDLNNVSLHGCAAHCGHHLQHLLAAGYRQHNFCCRRTPAPSAPSWTSRRCRLSICRMPGSRTT